MLTDIYRQLVVGKLSVIEIFKVENSMMMS